MSAKLEILKAACERSLVGGENLGMCTKCDNVQGGCEPDAEKYKCEACGEHKVYGVEWLAEKVVEYHKASKEKGLV